MAEVRTSESTADLVRQAADQLTTLVRDEMALAKAEMSEKAGLAVRADVKARAQDAVDDAKLRARGALDTVAYQVGKQREKVAALSPPVRVAIAAAAVGLVALLLIRRLRHRRSQ